MIDGFTLTPGGLSARRSYIETRSVQFYKVAHLEQVGSVQEGHTLRPGRFSDRWFYIDTRWAQC